MYFHCIAISSPDPGTFDVDTSYSTKVPQIRSDSRH